MRKLTLLLISLIAFTSAFATEKGKATLCVNKPLASQMTGENTIYVIKRNINLKGKTIVVPKGCVLEFKKGKLRNGTIIGNGTRIDAEKRQIFENIEIDPKGTWENHRGYPEWFGASDNPSVDSKMPIQRAIDVADTCILSQKYYTSFDTPTGRGDSQSLCAIAIKGTIMIGEPRNRIVIDAKHSNTEKTSVFWVGDNVTVDGVNIEYVNENHSGWTGTQAGVYRVQGGNVTIQNTSLRGAMAAWINLEGRPGRENYVIKNNYVHDCDCGLISQGNQHQPGEVYSIKLLVEGNTIEKEKQRHSEFVSFWGGCVKPGRVYYTDVTIKNNRFSGGYQGGCIVGHPDRTGLKKVVITDNQFNDCGACSFYFADGMVYERNFVTGSTFIERQIKGTMGSYPDLCFYNCTNCVVDDCSCFGLTVVDCKNLRIGKLKQTLCLESDDQYINQKDYVTNFMGISAKNSTVAIDELVISPYMDENKTSENCKYYVHKGENSTINVKTMTSSIPVLVAKNKFKASKMNFTKGDKKSMYINLVK